MHCSKAASFCHMPVAQWRLRHLCCAALAQACFLCWAPPCRSYETSDLWPLLAAPADGVTVSFVKAERSTFRWGGTDEARIRALGHAVHELPNSGHCEQGVDSMWNLWVGGVRQGGGVK